jgi:hypothetical protein
MAYLSKILIASLRAIAEKGILNAGVPAGHLITLKERGYIESGPIGIKGTSGVEMQGFVLSDKGRRKLAE